MAILITYFVHGTTTDNEQNIATGWNPGELSTLGIKQAKELGKTISPPLSKRGQGELPENEKFDAIFCSDLKRAIDSARLAFPNQKIIFDERLREANYGTLNGENEKLVIYENHVNSSFPNGESMLDVEKRIKDFLDFLKQNYDDKNIAIMAHKAPQLALEVLLNNKTWTEAINTDWRKTKTWQPGWKYILN